MGSIRAFLSVLALSVFSIHTYGQVSTNGGSGLAATYPSLADAIAALNTAILTAPVVINVNADQTAPAGGYIITAQGTAVNTITLRGNNNIVVASNAHVPGSFMDAVFRLEGADYLTLEQFVMMENPSATNASDATNTVTEWGVALLAGSLTNGSQNNIIRNNTISLRVSTVDRNTFGIYSNVRHSTTNVLFGGDPTVFSGTNSNNKIHNNTINNVNFGISFTGSGISGNADTGNEMGGPVAGQGNIITEFGKVKSSVLYASHTDTNFGIQAINQVNETISNNTLVSNDITSSATVAGARGILKHYTADPTGTTVTTISKNLITLTYSATSSDVIGIYSTSAVAGGAGQTLNITDNKIIKCRLTASTTSISLRGINNVANVGTLNVTGNVIRGCTSAQTGGTFTAIENGGIVVNSININNNLLGNEEGTAILFTGTSAPNCQLIYNSNGGSACSLSISGNQFYGISCTNIVASTVTFIRTLNASVPIVLISNNLFKNIALNTSSTVYFFQRSSSSPANSLYTITGNQIVGSFSKAGTAGDLNILDTGSSLTAGANSSTIISNNNFSNITSVGTSRITGFSYNMGQSCIITGNTLSNWTAGGSSGQGNLGITVTAATIQDISRNVISNMTHPFAFIGINVSGSGTSAVLDSNQITGITTVANNTGLSYTGSHNTVTIRNNTIRDLTSTSAVIVALNHSVNSGATTSSIFKNKICGIQTNSTANPVTGLKLGKSSTNSGPCTITNNYIGDLKAPSSVIDNGIRAIEFASSSDASDYNFYFNTVYLNSTGGGGNFSASILTVTTGPVFFRLDLRNNIFVNTSTPNGTGLNTVYRGLLLTTALYKPTTNNNLIYAGVPGAQRLIYYSSVSVQDQTLGAFLSRVYPRDIRSVTELPSFISTSGSSSDFLHINTTMATRIESGGVQIAGINNDYDGVIRAGNVGYTGTGVAPDIGADEGEFILSDVLGPDISYTPLANTASLANRNLGNVSITDISGVMTTGGLKPRLYYKKKVQANTYNDNTNATDGWKYVEANGLSSPFDFDLDYALLNGGGPVVGDTIQYFVIAQDTAMTPNVGFSLGIPTLAPATVALDATHFPLTNTINAYAIKAGMQGDKTVCASGCDYPSLTNTGGIFEAINNGIVTDSLTIRIAGDLTGELGTHPLNAYAVNERILIRPFGGLHRTISGTAANGTPLIGLNGADNVIIDGIRAGGDSLTISNLSTSSSSGTSTIRFINGASGNNIARCRVLGSTVVSLGLSGAVIFFDQINAGNSNNTIENCDVGAAGLNLPTVLIYSIGSSAHTGNIITGCRLYDFFSATKSSAGIFLESATGWSILNNKLYQTAARTFTSSGFTHYGIAVSGGSGVQINNNTIGFTSPNGTGTYSLVGLSSSKWIPVDISSGTSGAPTEIQGNRVANISYTGAMSGTGSSTPLAVFRLSGGVINMGTIAGNIVGDSLVNASITYSSNSASSSDFNAFYLSSAGASINMRNNFAGGIEAALNGTGGVRIFGIQTAGTTLLDCRFNTIGGPTANSIQCLSSNSSFVRGIVHNASTSATISDNIIRNLTSNCSIAGTPNLIGIAINSTALQTISRNRIYNLTGTTVAAVSTSNVGIQLWTSTTTGMVSTIDANQIHSMEVSNSSQPVIGIQLVQGLNTCSNNMIRLGLKADGSAMTVACEMYGFLDELGTLKLFHNSVYIGGTGVLNSAFPTAAFRRVNSTAFEVRNNIFSNGRQNASTGGKHYNLSFATGTMSNNLNHNVYYNMGGNGNLFALYASGDVATLPAWIALATSLNRIVDQNSYAENPFFILPEGSSSSGNLHIQSMSNSVVEGRGNSSTGVTLDIDGQSRGAVPDIGADEGMFASPVITYERLDGTISLSNRTLSNVTITSSDGVNTSPGTKPRVYFKKKTDANDAAGWKYVESVSSGTPFSFVIDYALLNAGMVSPLDTIQYFVIAQDLAMTPSVAIEDGFANSVPANVNLGAPAFPITGNINSYAIRRTISGTKTICASGCDYTSLTNNGGVFNDINNLTVNGNLLVEIRDNLLAETGTHPLNAYTPGYTITIRPAGGLTRVVSGAIAAGKPLIDFNGADSVLVDGRNTGGDSLFITNTSTSSTFGTSTIQFRNDSRSCTIRNCIISGSSTSNTSGTIFIATNVILTGNDNIKLIKNTIGAAGSNTPAYGIYIVGASPSFENNNIVIDSNDIKDYFIASGSCAGVLVGSNCPNILISNNHFFQSAPRIKTGGSYHCAIRVSSSAIVTGNTIGGSNPSNTGTYAITGVAATKIYPIYIGTAATASSTITGNTIRNISMSGAMNANTASTAPFSAIYVSTGVTNISGNLIGDTTATGNITYTSTGAGLVMGICNSAGGNLVTNYNSIGGITLTEGGSSAILFRGISTEAGANFTWNCRHNMIGGNVPASIQNNSTTSSNVIIGLQSSNTPSFIDSNTVRNLKGAQFAGITTSAGAVNSIRYNEIFNLQVNTFTTSSGILVNTSTNTTVEGNKIHSLLPGTSSTSLYGISVQGAAVNVINNMIRLGLKDDGTSVESSHSFYGILVTPGTESNVYFNSVYIGGNVTGTAANNTFCARFDNSLKNVRNNIFYNARSNVTTGGKHYSLSMANITGMVVDHNVYHVTGTNGILANIVSADKVSIEALRSATLQDANSSAGDPKFINPTGTAALFNLHIDTTVETPVEGNGVAIAGYNLDYDGQSRAALSPVDIGADAGSFMGKDMILPVITYADLSVDYVKTSRPLGNVLITDNASGIDTASGLRPRLYFKKSTDPNTDTEWKYVEANGTSSPFDFTINYSLLTAGSVSVGDVIQYFVVAEDTATTPNVGKNAAIFSTTPASVALVSAQFPINGTIKSYTIIDTLVGTRTVCASGCDFTSLTNNDAGGAFKAINDRILTADVVLQITSDLTTETGAVSLNAFAAPYTVTIKPDGAPRLVSYSGAASMIILNGADRVIIDGSLSNTTNSLCPLVQASRDLTFKNTATSASIINLRSQPTNPASNNMIKNCNIEGDAASTTIFGIASTDQTVTISSLGKDNDNNSFVNNAISKVQYGIYSQGESRSNKNQGTIINLNTIDLTSSANTAVAGVYLGFENNAQLSGNTIKNISNSTKSVAGIAMGLLPSLNMTVFTGNDVTNSLVSHNTIRDITRIGDGSAFGITMAAVIYGSGSTNEVSNNVLFNIKSTAATTMEYVAGVLVGGGAVGTTKVLYNTIHLTGVSAYSAPGFAMAIGAGNPGIEMKNNIFVNEMTSTLGKNYALGLAYNGSFSNLNADRNNFFTTASPLAIAGGLNNTPSGDLSNLTALRALTGKDLNSKNVLPEFVSSTDLHLTTATVNLINLDGKGMPVSATTDIDCDTRNASTPDIGADEIAGCNYPLISSLAADVNPIPCSGNTSNLTVTGTLNDATDWKWYKSGCGMTLVGTGPSIPVMPDASTTYYVRGEGGCVSENACLSISITISGALTTNTNDGGVGSLREAITCAGDGDTLAFDPGVLNPGDTIMITTSALSISKNLYIDQGPSAIVKIKTTGTHSVFDVNPGSSLSVRNVHLFMNPASPNTQGRAIYNEGSLTLKDVEIYERQVNLSGSGSTVHNLAGALIEIVSGCQLKVQ